MVFEAITTMMSQINFFGTGMFIIIGALVFAISRGLTKSKSEIFLYTFIIGMFAILTVFPKLVTYIGISLSIVAILYSFTYFKEDRSSY